MGSLLIAKGYPASSCLAALNIENPSLIQDIHKQYQNAGAHIIYSHTFMASKPALKQFNKEHLFIEINKKAVQHAKQHKTKNIKIAGNIGGIWPQKDNQQSLNVMAKAYQEQINILYNQGVDLIVIETIMNEKDLLAAIQGTEKALHKKIPFVISITPNLNGCLYDQTPPQIWVHHVKNSNASGIGLNCFFDPANQHQIINNIINISKLPLFLKLNAGQPTKRHGHIVYPITAKEFCNQIQNLLDLRFAAIGGCCGTTPQYIKELSELIK